MHWHHHQDAAAGPLVYLFIEVRETDVSPVRGVRVEDLAVAEIAETKESNDS
jgi:hypothetical protein